jgi:hypothetical protein
LAKSIEFEPSVAAIPSTFGLAEAIVQDAEGYQHLLDIAAQAHLHEGIRQGREDLEKGVRRAKQDLVRLFFKRASTSRIIYAIEQRKNAVTILHIRHGARLRSRQSPKSIGKFTWPAASTVSRNPMTCVTATSVDSRG